MSDRLAEWRRKKDASFVAPGQTPLTPEQIDVFAGLLYFDEAADFRFEVEIQEFPERKTLEMQTSAGEPASYERYGTLHFSVDGDDQTLTVFLDPRLGLWFLPFRDASSGKETYGAGRYLELEPGPDGKVVLDFNYAYNPYCAYNANWVCPIPPAENRLTAAILAGEKSFK